MLRNIVRGLSAACLLFAASATMQADIIQESFTEWVTLDSPVKGHASITWTGLVDTSDIGQSFTLSSHEFVDGLGILSNSMSPDYLVDPTVTPKLGGGFYLSSPVFSFEIGAPGHQPETFLAGPNSEFPAVETSFVSDSSIHITNAIVRGVAGEPLMGSIRETPEPATYGMMLIAAGLGFGFKHLRRHA